MHERRQATVLDVSMENRHDLTCRTRLSASVRIISASFFVCRLVDTERGAGHGEDTLVGLIAADEARGMDEGTAWGY
jgi:hypothetical protein